MSELREAHEAIQRRHESVWEAMNGATEQTEAEANRIIRRVYVGMDLDADDVNETAIEYASEIVQSIAERVEDGETISLIEHLAAAWADGVSVGAMLFLRRQEGNTR